MIQPAGVLRVSGEDTADYLQSQATADLRPLRPGDAAYTLFLTPKGGLAADAFAVRLDDETFLLASPHVAEAQLAEKVGANIVADDVEIEPESNDWRIVLMLGESKEAPKGYEIPGRFGNASHRAFLVEAQMAEAFRAAASQAELGTNVLSRLRIEAGLPAIGIETTEKDLPAEWGLTDAICFTKGCFLGQEVANRLRTRGQSRRKQVVVELSEAVETPAELEVEGREIGSLRGLAGDDGSFIGLAMIKLEKEGTLPSGPYRVAHTEVTASPQHDENAGNQT